MSKAFSLARSVFAFGLGPLVALATAPILAHSLGPAGRGQLAAILQPLTIADSLAGFGIPAAVAYFVARGADRSAVRGMALRVIAVPAGIAYLALLLYGFAVSARQDLPYGPLAAIWTAVLVGSLIAVRRAELSGGRSWRLLDTERSVTALGRLSAISAMAAAGLGSVLLFAAVPLLTGVLASFVILVVLPRMLRREGGEDQSGAPLAFPRFLGYATSASLGTMTLALSARIDQLVLPLVVPADELGYYVVGVTVSEVSLIVGMVLSRNLLAETASSGVTRSVYLTLVGGVLLALAFAILVTAIAPWAVPLVFGADFVPSVSIVGILAYAAVFSVAIAGLGAVINGLGRPLLASLAYAAPVVAMLAYALLAGGAITIEGTARVMLCGQVIGTIMLALILLLVSRQQRRPDDRS